MAIEISEKQFEAQIKDLAKIYHWKYYHTWKSIHSPAGFPDIVMVKPPRLIFAELKSEKGKITPEQEEWLSLLRQCGSYPSSSLIDDKGLTLVYQRLGVYLWRPSDFETIIEILKR